MNFKQEIKDKEYLHSIEIDDLKDMHSQGIKKLKTSTRNKLEFQTEYLGDGKKFVANEDHLGREKPRDKCCGGYTRRSNGGK